VWKFAGGVGHSTQLSNMFQRDGEGIGMSNAFFCSAYASPDSHPANPRPPRFLEMRVACVVLGCGGMGRRALTIFFFAASLRSISAFSD
jgi:hypothetical protein